MARSKRKSFKYYILSGVSCLIFFASLLFLIHILPQRQTIKQHASTIGTYTISDDTTTGHITVENSLIKAVLHYKTLPQENNNQSGGNMYELYDKVTSPTENLIDVWNGGSGATGAYGVGVGGIGSTQMFVIQNPANQPPTAPQTTYDASISDNDLNNELVTHVISTDANGSPMIMMEFTVGQYSATQNTDWYDIKKPGPLMPMDEFI